MLFYKSIVDGFSEILEFHEEIDCSGFPIDQKVAYLHNSAVLEAIQTYFGGFDSAKVKQFVQNIAASKEREVFSGYLDIYSGNTKKRLSMYEALEKLKKDVGDRNCMQLPAGKEASHMLQLLFDEEASNSSCGRREIYSDMA